MNGITFKELKIMKSNILHTNYFNIITLVVCLMVSNVGRMWGATIASWGKVSIAASTNVTASGGDANNNGVAKFQSNKAMTSAGGSSSKCYYGSNAGGAVITFTNLNLSSYSSIQMTFYARASQSGYFTVAYSADGTNWVNIGVASLSSTEGQKTITGIPWFATYLRLTHSASSGSLYFGTTVISGTSAASKTVTWYVNGSTTTTGSPTTSVPSGGTVAKLPTDPSSCDPSKVFVGWTNSTYSHATNAPTILFTTVQGAPAVTANTEYHAVFANRTDFTRVTSTSDLAAGKQIVVVDNYNSKVLTTAPGYATAPTESSSKITPSNNMIWFLEANSTNWKLKTGSAYLGTFNTVDNTEISYSSSNNIWTIGSSSSGTNNFYFKNTSGTNFCLEYYSGKTKWVGYANAGYSSSTYFTERLYVATLTNYATSCAACEATPSVGAASLNGTFSLSSVGVQCASASAGDGCSLSEYGFVWGTSNSSGHPNKDDNVVTNAGVYSANYTNSLTPILPATAFSTGTTYYYRGYAKNNGDIYGYSAVVQSFTPYKVYYNANGGTGSIDDQIVNTGGSVTLSDGTGFSKDGYHITKWALGSASGTQSDPSSSSGSVTANKEYYAIWTANTYTVTFDKNGGSGDAMSGQAFTYGTAQNLSANTYTAPDHMYFLGWNTDKDATTALYEDGESVNNLTTENSGTVTLYAIWKEHTYTAYRTNCCTKAMLAFDEDEYEDQIRQDQHGSVGSTNKFELDIPFTTSSTGTSYTTEIKKLTYGSRDKSAAGSSCTDETAASVNSSTSPKTVTFHAWSTNPGENYKGQGTYRIKLIQAADGDYCQGVDYVFVDVVMRDKFVDAVNGNTTINRDGTGSAVTTPAEASLTETDECHETTRRLLGWIKETDLESWYGSTSRVSDLDDKKNDSKIVAPNTDVKASAVTWYAVWGEEVAP